MWHCHSALSAHAQDNAVANENARQLQRERERNDARLEQLQPPSNVQLEAETLPLGEQALPTNETPCFTIHTIHLEGEEAEQFQWVLHRVIHDEDHHTPLLGRCLGAKGINIIMARMQNALVEQGLITTRIVAGPQELNTGELRLTVIPGRIHTIRFSDGQSHHNVLPMREGELLNLRDIEHALESFKRLPSVDTNIGITPSSGSDTGTGDSDLTFDYEAGFPLRLILSADNAGSDSTGQYQGNMALAYDNPFGLHDLLNIYSGHDIGGGDPLPGGTESYGLNYQVPYGYWTYSVNMSRNDYFLTLPATSFQTPTTASGKSLNASVKATRLVHRNATSKTHANLALWHRSSRSFSAGRELDIQRQRTGGYEFTLDHQHFIGRSTLTGSATYRKGTGIFNSLPAPTEDNGGGTARPSIVRTDLSLSVPFAIAERDFIYQSRWRRQLNRTPLVTQDHFSIGSRYSVRGFDGENPLSAERGWFIRNDVAMLIGNRQHSLYLGADYGDVTGRSAQPLLGNHLAGGVLGIKGQWGGFSYDVSFAQPIKQPDGYRTDNTSVDISLVWAF